MCAKFANYFGIQKLVNKLRSAPIYPSSYYFFRGFFRHTNMHSDFVPLPLLSQVLTCNYTLR
jgi:hypothetical protein